MKKSRPKFKYGQVVYDKETGLYKRIHSSQRMGSTFWYGLLTPDGCDYCIDEARLRKQTKREIGPR